MNKNGRQKQTAVFSLMMIMVLAACPTESEDPSVPIVKSVTVTPAPWHGVIFPGEPGTLDYIITIDGNNLDIIDLLAPDIILGWVDPKGQLVPVQGIEISRDIVQIVTAGVPSLMKISVDIPDRTTYVLALSVRGVISAAFPLYISALVPATSVAVVPDPADPGAAYAGAPGILNFRITVTGVGIHPLDLLGPDVAFKLVTPEGLKDLPSGISVLPGIVRTPQSTSFNILVERPEVDNYQILVLVYGRPSAIFDVNVLQSELTGTVNITPGGQPVPAITLQANTAGLPGGDFTFRWQKAPYPGANFIDIPNAAADSYTVKNDDSGFRLRVVVTSNETKGAVVSDPSIPVPGVAVNFAELGEMASLPATALVEAKISGERLAPQVLYFGGRPISITLRAASGASVIPHSSGYLFTVGRGVTLILENITLQGTDNKSALILVEEGGALIMGSNSRITSNMNTAPASDLINRGGAIKVAAGGTFTMNAGTITGNHSAYGGGVYCQGSFNMNGGTITTNTATATGGGVFLFGGNLALNSGTITNNTALSAGGVDVTDGSYFQLTGGTISFNRATEPNGYGGGIRVSTSDQGNPSRLDLVDGIISNNSADNGGGVAQLGFGVVRHFGTTISGNTAKADGGGVYNAQGDYTMQNASGGPIGTISSNSALRGGGVNNQKGGFFIISTGIIHGVDEVRSGLRNIVTANNASAEGATLLSFGTGSQAFALPLDENHDFKSYYGFRFGSVDLTLDVLDAKTQAIFIHDIPDDYDGHAGALWAQVDGGNDYPIGPWLVPPPGDDPDYPEDIGRRNVGFLFPVTPKEWKFDLDFYSIEDMMIIDLEATYALTKTIVRGENEIEFVEFGDVTIPPPRIRSITITDLPDIHQDLDLYLLARLDHEGEDSPYNTETWAIVARVIGPIRSSSITFLPGVVMLPRVWELNIAHFIYYAPSIPVGLFEVKVPLEVGANEISFKLFKDILFGDIFGNIAPPLQRAQWFMPPSERSNVTPQVMSSAVQKRIITPQAAPVQIRKTRTDEARALFQTRTFSQRTPSEYPLPQMLIKDTLVIPPERRR